MVAGRRWVKVGGWQKQVAIQVGSNGLVKVMMVGMKANENAQKYFGHEAKMTGSGLYVRVEWGKKTKFLLKKLTVFYEPFYESKRN